MEYISCCALFWKGFLKAIRSLLSSPAVSINICSPWRGNLQAGDGRYGALGNSGEWSGMVGQVRWGGCITQDLSSTEYGREVQNIAEVEAVRTAVQSVTRWCGVRPTWRPRTWPSRPLGRRSWTSPIPSCTSDWESSIPRTQGEPVFSRPGLSQGLLYKQLRHSLIHLFIL